MGVDVKIERTQEAIYTDILDEIGRHRKKMLELELERMSSRKSTVSFGGKEYDFTTSEGAKAFGKALAKCYNKALKKIVDKATKEWEEMQSARNVQ